MNILFTSVGRRSGTVRCFRESLKGQCGIFGANATEGTTGLFSVDRAFILPRADNKEYLDALLKVCRDNGVRMIFSLHDLETYILSTHKDILLGNGIHFIGPSAPMGYLCLDKYAFYLWASRHRVAVPETFLDLSTVMKALVKKQVSFPLILKPRYGFGSLGIQVAHDSEELKAAYLLVENFKYNFCLPNGNGTGTAQGKCLIQQYVRGAEYSVEIVNDLQGRYLGAFIKRKLEMGGVEADAVVTERKARLMAFSRKLSDLMGIAGVVDLDLFVTGRGRIILIEVNPRLGAGYPFSHEAGADVPKIFKALVNKEKVAPGWLQLKEGMVMARGVTVLPGRLNGHRSKKTHH